jgi:hypothetical protein
LKENDSLESKYNHALQGWAASIRNSVPRNAHNATQRNRIVRRRCAFSTDDFVNFGVLARRRDLWTGLPKVQCPQHSNMGMHQRSPAFRCHDRRGGRRMSGSGQSLPKWDVRATSASPLIATEGRTSRDVSNVPKADSCAAANRTIRSPHRKGQHVSRCQSSRFGR